MKKTLTFIGAFIIISLLSVNIVARGPVNKGESANILWIGNSYTYYNDLPEMLASIAEWEGIKINNTKILKGGESLAGHLTNPELYEALNKTDWDFVVLQEFSSGPAYSTKYVAENIYPAAETIDSLLHASCPNANTVLYMTWGHKNGNIRQTTYPLDDDYDLMQERIKTTYIDLGHDLEAWVAPAGIAWQGIMKSNPEIELYTSDDFHPSLAGSWLAANAIFSTLYQKDYSAIYPEELDPEVASLLLHVAQEAVNKNKHLLNLDLPD